MLGVIAVEARGLKLRTSQLLLYVSTQSVSHNSWVPVPL